MDYVYAVYIHKSFSKAADELYISQPALSAAVKKVENDIGLPIFDRRSNPIQLTAAGDYYIASIEKIMQQEKEMRSHFNHLLDTSRYTINVGGASFFCTYILPTIVQQFKEEYPDYTVNLLEANADDLMKYLRNDIVDMMIDVEQKGRSSLYESFVWAKEHVVLAVPASYKVNESLTSYRLTFSEVASGRYVDDIYPNVNLGVFKHEPFLLLKKGNDMYERSITMCQNANFTPNVTMYLDQLLTSYHIARNGKGIAFIRAGITRHLEQTDNLFFYKINDSQAYQQMMLYYKKGKPLSHVSTRFIEFLNKEKLVHLA